VILPFNERDSAHKRPIVITPFIAITSGRKLRDNLTAKRNCLPNFPNLIERWSLGY